MQRLTGTFEPAGKPSDAWHKVELPYNGSVSQARIVAEEGPSPMTLGPASPGLESVLSVHSTEKETYHRTSSLPEKETFDHSLPEFKNENTYHRSPKGRKTWLSCAIIIVACIAIGLGAGLGVGLSKKRYGFTL